MTAIWRPGSPLLDAVAASQGRAFARYLPLAHPAPTPYHTRAYAGTHSGKFPAVVDAFEKTQPQRWVKPWFNDPSCMVWDEKNQFFRGFSISQSNPDSQGGDQQTWMEIVSPDLVTFINNRSPFYLDNLPYPALWGGSFLIDRHNAAGYGAGAVLYYISVPGSDTSPLQCVSLWIAPALGLAPVYHGIVLENPGVGEIVYAPGMDFRDPRVSWDDDRSRFVMKLTVGRGIAFYGSTDGLNWQFLSLIVLSDWQQIETPDLVPMEVPDGSQKWLLAFSIKQWNNQPASSVAYLVGDWDGNKFTPDFTTPKRLNWGSDYYAQALFQHEGNTYCWGWMGNWNYMELPQQGFGGNHSLVTQLSLAQDVDGSLGLRMQFMPDQLNCYAEFTDAILSLPLSGSGTSQWQPPVQNMGVSWRMDLQFYRDAPDPWPDAISVNFCVGPQNRTTLTLNPQAGTVTLSRSQSGGGPLDTADTEKWAKWNADQVATLPNRARYFISIIVDVSTIEIIINDEVYISSLFFPPEDAFSSSVTVSGNGTARLLYFKQSY